ncbi:MAG: FAD-dependent oxidoreductase [Proteobacteria bacterium]|nr:FAD-dependent oxidoreductase [Pseudomonadota bacterium]
MKVIICGASAAGLSCLTTLINQNKSIDCTIISEEKVYPYSRCLLTNLLGKEISEKEMEISNPDLYPDNVKWVFGERLIKIDPKRQTIQTDRGSIFSYDKLLLAVGAEAIKPSYMLNCDRMFNLRFLRDSVSIDRKLKNSVLVVGGGFVGIKTAYGLIHRGIKPSLIMASNYPLSTTVDEETGMIIKDILQEMGITIYTNTDIGEVKQKNGTLYLTLTNDKILDCDVAIIGKGVTPRVKEIENSGIKINKGIVVDEFMQTSIENIYSAGDCCETYDIVKEVNTINAIWPNAVEQGYCAGMNMLGYKIPYPGSIAMNSVKTSHFHLISAGDLKDREGKLYSYYIKAKKQLRKIAIKNERIIGCAFLNDPNYAGVIVELIKNKKPVSDEFVRKVVNGEITPLDYYKKF